MNCSCQLKVSLFRPVPDYLSFSVFPFPSEIELFARNVSCLHVKVRGFAPFFMLLAENSVMNHPNYAALTLNQIQSNQNFPNVLNLIFPQKEKHKFRNKIVVARGLSGCLNKDAFPTEFLPGDSIKVNPESDLAEVKKS